MNCPECGSDVPVSHFVSLCDRCLKAKLWELLEGDDYVLVRRKRGGGQLSISSRHNGGVHYTNLTLSSLDLNEELHRRVEEIFT